MSNAAHLLVTYLNWLYNEKQAKPGYASPPSLTDAPSEINAADGRWCHTAHWAPHDVHGGPRDHFETARRTEAPMPARDECEDAIVGKTDHAFLILPLLICAWSCDCDRAAVVSIIRAVLDMLRNRQPNLLERQQLRRHGGARCRTRAPPGGGDHVESPRRVRKSEPRPVNQRPHRPSASTVTSKETQCKLPVPLAQEVVS